MIVIKLDIFKTHVHIHVHLYSMNILSNIEVDTFHMWDVYMKKITEVILGR